MKFLGNKRLGKAAAAVAFAVVAFAPAHGGGQNLGMLDAVDAGTWELRVRGPGGAPERMCIDNGRRFIQLRHRSEACDRFVVHDSPSDVTVQYTCRGRGYGRTHIRRETNRLLQIDSQGIAQGLPFEFAAEARRVGDCTT